MASATQALKAIVAAWDAPHYGDVDTRLDNLSDPIEAARVTLAEIAALSGAALLADHAAKVAELQAAAGVVCSLMGSGSRAAEREAESRLKAAIAALT